MADEFEGRVQVVDGANGYVGSNLVRSLLDDGASVVALSRAGDAETRRKVDGAVIADISGSYDPKRLAVIPYELDRPDLGLGSGVDDVFGTRCDFWHLAANITFQPGCYEEIESVNVGGTANTLTAFGDEAALGSLYHFVSTAYCCGTDTIQPVERWYDLAPPTAFRNFYEASKRAAELTVRTAFEREQIRGTVLRLGQVVGSSVSGRATTDYGLYNLIRAISAIARRRPDHHVRIEGHPDANLHLVPIDITIDAMRAVASHPAANGDGRVAHLVEPVPVLASEVLAAIERHLPMRMTLVSPDDLNAEPRTQLERVVAARIAYTGSYLARPFEFGRATLDSLGVAAGPTVSPEVLDLIIEQFVESLCADRRHEAAV